MKRYLGWVILVVGLTACRTAPIGWTQVETRGGPPPMGEHVFVYRASVGRSLLFGGITEEEWLSTTWEWDGKKWHELFPEHQPPGREKAAMIYDEARDRIVLFGGQGDGATFDDTWEWDGTDWHEIVPDHRPPARCCHAMAYDPVQQKVLLYGGWNPSGIFYGDTWLWDGQDWAQQDVHMPDMSAHAIHTAPEADMVIAVLVNNLGTWSWDGSEWDLVNVPESPDMPNARLASDPDIQRLVLFGGSRDGISLNEMWIFEQQEWRKLDLPGAPSARFGHGLVYDARLHRFWMFGGVSADGFLNDMWQLVLPEDISDVIEATPTGSSASAP